MIEREWIRTISSESTIQLAMTGMYRSTSEVCLLIKRKFRTHFVQISPIMIMILFRITASVLTSNSRINIYLWLENWKKNREMLLCECSTCDTQFTKTNHSMSSNVEWRNQMWENPTKQSHYSLTQKDIEEGITILSCWGFTVGNEYVVNDCNRATVLSCTILK